MKRLVTIREDWKMGARRRENGRERAREREATQEGGRKGQRKKCADKVKKEVRGRREDMGWGHERSTPNRLWQFPDGLWGKCNSSKLFPLSVSPALWCSQPASSLPPHWASLKCTSMHKLGPVIWILCAHMHACVCLSLYDCVCVCVSVKMCLCACVFLSVTTWMLLFELCEYYC